VRTGGFSSHSQQNAIVAFNEKFEALRFLFASGRREPPAYFLGLLRVHRK
jgi:hypothetical protein